MATVVLYPCSQFDYITSSRSETEAMEIFEAWIAAHHPALLEMNETMPRWETALYAPFNLQQDIVIVPPCCESSWNDNWEQQTADCTVIRNAVRREEIVQKILSARNYSGESFDDDFISDFYAVAAARFLLALFHRNMSYIQTPDEYRLKTLTTDAIRGKRNNEPNTVQQALQSAFDEIAMAKDNYHPSQNYLIELVLATKNTVGKPLRQMFEESPQINLFMPNDVLATLPETHPETFAHLKQAVEQNKVRFIADDTESQSLTLLPILDAADSILAGLSVYRELLNVSPKVYGRLTTGMTPALPQLLKLSEMEGAVHFAPLAGWQVKEQDQSKVVWQGTDNTAIDALVRYPLDASAYFSFFEMADQFSTQTHQDSVPTAVFALFPGQKSGWLPLLRRMNRFSTGLGKCVSIDEYFNDTAHSGNLERYGYDKYPTDALSKVEQNPLSQWNELYRKNTDRLVESSLETMLRLLNRPATQMPLVQQFVQLTGAQHVDCSLDDGLVNVVIVNPFSFARKVFINDTAVAVPPLGYAFVGPKTPTETPVKKSLLGQLLGNKGKPVLARKATDDLGRGEKRAVYLLENRYFTAKFDALTGALRSIFTNHSRFNQLSRQIAFRKNMTYSIQAADEIVITKATTEVGQIKITGRLVFSGDEVAARFTETVTIRSQSRLIEFDLMLDPLMEFEDDRWKSYISVRYAWNDDTFSMSGGLNDGVYVLSDQKHLLSPKFIDLRHEGGSFTFLTEGLPFHRRSGNRQLDTLLIVKEESQRQFRLGIAVNAKNPMLLSYDFLLDHDKFILPVRHRPKNPSSWLFQIESHNVMALYWEPVWEEEKLTGYMVYLQEMEGRRTHFALRSFLLPKRAAAVNLLGKERQAFKVDADAVLLDIHAHELLPLLVGV